MAYVSDRRKTNSGNHRTKHGRRLGPCLSNLSEKERADACTACTLSRCREGSPCCNLTRTYRAKRRAYRERATVHANSNAE